MRLWVLPLVILSATVVAAEEPTPSAPAAQKPVRVLAAPKFPDSFKDRFSNEGVLETDFGKAKFRDMIARRGAQTLTVREFHVPAQVWKVKSPKRMLDDARNNITMGGLLPLSEKDSELDGFARRSFLFLQPDRQTAEYMDYILMEPVLYIFAYSGPKAGLEEKEIVEFFKSEATVEKK